MWEVVRVQVLAAICCEDIDSRAHAGVSDAAKTGADVSGPTSTTTGGVLGAITSAIPGMGGRSSDATTTTTTTTATATAEPRALTPGGAMADGSGAAVVRNVQPPTGAPEDTGAAGGVTGTEAPGSTAQGAFGGARLL